MESIPTISTDYPDPSSASACRCRGGHQRAAVPLLALAPPALALGEEILGAGDEETNVRDLWNFISRASDIVKDGERLENLAWRQWCQHRRDSNQSTASHIPHNRRVSTSSSGTTASSTSPLTPNFDHPPSPTISAWSPQADRRTFGSALKLLMEEDQFIDWVSDAQRNLPPPTISVPDTPIAQLEIRLVEPTPVPSRVGSLGGSMSGVGMLGIVVPPRLTEEPEGQEIVEEDEEEETDVEVEEGVAKPARPLPVKPARPAKKQGKFFLQSSPKGGVGSGSDTVVSPNGTSAKSTDPPTIPPLSPSLSLSPDIRQPVPKGKHRRTSSGSSASAGAPVAAVKKRSPSGKRNVSLSTMRGRFCVEKRKAAEVFAQKLEAEAQLAAAAAHEEEGWEDEEGDDIPEEAEEEAVVPVEALAKDETTPDVLAVDKGKGRAVLLEPEAEEDNDDDYEDTEEEGSAEEDGEGDWSDEGSDGKPPAQLPQAPSPTKKPPQPPPDPPPGFPLAPTPVRRTSSSKSLAPPPIRRTSSSKSANAKASTSRNKSTSNLDLAGLFARPSARRNPSSGTMPPPPAPTPLRDMSRKQRLAAQEERKKIEAELDAQKKREMFAKQHIFGPKPTQSEGLLSGIFKKGGSMVDLTAAGAPQLISPPLRPSPTHVHLPSMARSPITLAPALLRSKSAVAVPVQTGVSVTRVSPHRSRLNEVIASSSSPDANVDVQRPRRSSDRSDKSGTKSGSNERRPPAGVELESDDSSSEEDDYLATSSTQRKLAELAEKQARRGKGRSPEIDQIAAMAGPSIPVPAAQQIAQNGQAGVRFDVPGAVEPMTPTTRRRTIISREMSMSLRQNLLLEREKSSGGGKRRTSVGPSQHSRPPPITHTSHLPTRNLSTADLGQYQMGVPLARHRSETALHREAVAAQQRQSPPVVGEQQHGQAQFSQSPTALVHPQPHRSTSGGSVITINTRHRAPVHPLLNQGDRPPHTQAPFQSHTQAPSPQPEQPRRRTQPSVLGGFLRPLTRVGTPAGPPDAARNAAINRTQSSANLTSARREAGSPHLIEAPAMVRRSTTEGGSSVEWKAEVDRRRELARKASDSSYRAHGW